MLARCANSHKKSLILPPTELKSSSSFNDMSQTRISKHTKAQLIQVVSYGSAIPDALLPFLGSDPEFVKALLLIAKSVGNSKFGQQLMKYLKTQENRKRVAADEQRKSNVIDRAEGTVIRKRRGRITAKEVYNAIKDIPFRRASNYAPRGISLNAFLREKGIPVNDYHPNSTGKPIRFFQGGSPGQGKRA